MTDTPHTCGLAMMLEVKVQEDRFYLPRHDAEQLAGAMGRARSAGMVREEGSVHRHSQHLLLSLPACVHRFVKVPSLSTGAPTSHARQQLPATRARGQSPLLKQYQHALVPGRRARSREGHTEERTEAHDTGEIDCKEEELEVPMGTSRLVPSRSTCRAPIWTRAHAL
jgi:hypothetical protein